MPAVPASLFQVLNFARSYLHDNESRCWTGDDAKEWKPERWLAPPTPSVTEAHILGVYSHMDDFQWRPSLHLRGIFQVLSTGDESDTLTLLASFRSTMSHKEHDIIWNYAAIRYPTVGKHTTMPSFPMLINPVKLE
ncbi:unnamed protein product [Somion occarium]|uniref:Uncharacterized protein n=1 Tax=Somion occarium TaxID=3059160 RepID=A0ABP1CPM1_9APHY